MPPLSEIPELQMLGNKSISLRMLFVISLCNVTVLISLLLLMIDYHESSSFVILKPTLKIIFAVPFIFPIACFHTSILMLFAKRTLQHACLLSLMVAIGVFLFSLATNLSPQYYVNRVLGSEIAKTIKLIELKTYDSFNNGDTYFIHARMLRPMDELFIKSLGLNSSESTTFNTQIKSAFGNFVSEQEDMFLSNKKMNLIIKSDRQIFLCYRTRRISHGN